MIFIVPTYLSFTQLFQTPFNNSDLEPFSKNNSSLSFPRIGDHWSIVLSLQCAAIRHQCGHDISALSLPPRNLQSFVPAPHRAVVHA